MKAIILISSIFYLLGFKVSHKIDVKKDQQPSKTINSVIKENVNEHPESISLKEGLSITSTTDSLTKAGIQGDRFLRSK